MTRSIRLLAATLVLATATGGAKAEVPDFDLNADGRVDRAEFVAGRDARFARLDRNHDTVISDADFPAGSHSLPVQARMGKLFASADIDRDGTVTREELGTSGTPLFDKADANGNYYIDGAELTELRNMLRDAAGEPHSK
jgi:Ca2+-binding EF-hand superfamily protein